MMNYLVYLTTNLINGKKYIGSHATENIEDGYLGSRIIFKKAVKKYGRSNFEREILGNIGDRETMLWLEEYYCEYFNVANNDLFYNRTNKSSSGVKGISNIKNKIPKSDVTKNKISKSLIGKRLGIKQSKETCVKKSISMLGKLKNKPKSNKFICNSIDSTIYTFQHKSTGEIINLTRYDFYTKYNSDSGTVSGLLKGKCKSIKGWKLL